MILCSLAAIRVCMADKPTMVRINEIIAKKEVEHRTGLLRRGSLSRGKSNQEN